MKYFFPFLFFGISVQLLAQPGNPFYVTIDPAEVEQLLGSQRRTIDMMRVHGTEAPVIDGEKDPVWDHVPAGNFDKYIRYYTTYSEGSYRKVSLLSDGDDLRRLPSSSVDFSGSYRLLYDDDYLYCFYDITDNQVNYKGNPSRPSFWEEAVFHEAPYPDSAQQLLGSNPYPPYTGSAGEINKKFCYWAYLGAFKINFVLADSGKCEISITPKSDAVKIDYAKRQEACHCAWKMKSDNSGYYQEVAISLKVTLADSAGHPFVVPATSHDIKWIAFDMGVYDRDEGMNEIQASWNSENSNLWDVMIYTGKLMMKGWDIGLDGNQQPPFTFYPNPASDVIFFNEPVLVEIVSMDGTTMRTERVVTQCPVSSLASGIYVVKINGVPAGKLIKL